MYYKELLRVSRGLKIVTGVFIVLGAAHAVYHKISGVPMVPHAYDHIPLAALFAFCGFIAMIFITCYGFSLASDNDGHLELAWTKPVSRPGYAVQMFLVDAAACVAVFVSALLFLVLAPLAIVGPIGYISVDRSTGLELLRYLALPIAWLGLLQALTASLRRHGGLVAGVTWLGAFIVLALAAAPLVPAWHTIFAVLAAIDPVAYIHYVGVGPEGVVQSPFTHPLLVNLGALVLIALGGMLAAVLQWRRVEA